MWRRALAARFDGIWLDLKLSVRMIARYPGLTVVGGAAMAFGIAVGVTAFEVRTQFLDPVMPLADGSRLVGLRIWDASANAARLPARADVEHWRDRLTLVREMGAFTSFSRNLITDDGRSDVEPVAAMSGVAFQAARVPPLMGRPLEEADAAPGAPPVVVIGHDVWTRRLAGDPRVLGKTIRLGSERFTVVGVMPEGFAFPAAHTAWVPLRDQPDQGLLVLGRLAPGVSRAQAQAELDAIGLQSTAGETAGDEHRRSQLVPYSWLLFDPSEMQLGLTLGNVFVVMLFVLVSANVALLMFARASSREAEMAVRSALGASRARIVGQLFVESLTLAALSVLAGVGAAVLALRSFLTMYQADSGRPLPFWVSDSLTTSTVIYAGALTMVAASIIGVLPALGVTGRWRRDRLRELGAGSGGFRFGGIWTGVIAAQVAATLTFPAAAVFFQRWVVETQARVSDLTPGRYLSARLELDGDPSSATPEARGSDLEGRTGRASAELERRLLADAQVAGLTFADRLPGMSHPRWRVEVEADAAAAQPLTSVSSAWVALNFFDLLGAPLLAGRGFVAGDLAADPRSVIVNQSFVERVLGGRNPIGHRIRRHVGSRDRPGPWLEIVGVVRDLGMGEDAAGVYRPLTPGTTATLRMAVAVHGDPQEFAPRLRALASDVDPALQIHDVKPLAEAAADQWLESQYLSRVLTILSVIALMLSLSAIYAVMAFTVSRRTREIGIRVALGADRRRVIGVVLRRPLVQVGLGVLSGALLVAAMFAGLYESAPTVLEVFGIAVYALIMMGVCLLACVVPTRRALRVEPARVLTGDS